MLDDFGAEDAQRLDAAARELATNNMLSILDAANALGCTDIHVRAERGIYGRKNGRVARLDMPAFTEEQITAMVEVTAKRRPPRTECGHFEYSFEAAGRARYRTHAFRENDRWALAIRAIPFKVPTFSELRLPPIIKSFTERAAGLVLITGPTGSGKSTTAASILEFMAAHHPLHIITVEDPIEYRLSGEAACVSQRELGRDVSDFKTGAFAAMREDPDVLFIGELRDLAAVETAVSLAESGHTVVSTFHTRSCVQTVSRLISLFPPDAQAAARERIADCLRGVISQRLIPTRNGAGMVLASEAMLGTLSVKEHIRDPGKMKSLTAHLERAGDTGMHSLDQSLYQLVQGNIVDAAAALVHAATPNDFKRRFRIAG